LLLFFAKELLRYYAIRKFFSKRPNNGIITKK